MEITFQRVDSVSGCLGFCLQRIEVLSLSVAADTCPCEGFRTDVLVCPKPLSHWQLVRRDLSCRAGAPGSRVVCPKSQKGFEAPPAAEPGGVE